MVRAQVGAAAVLTAAICLAVVGSAQAADSVYWSNIGGPISYAPLSGGAGGDISNTGSTGGNGPYGTAIDAADGRIYWTNYYGNSISYANLNGSGGAGTLNTSGTTVSNPAGLVLDLSTGRIYWANRGNNTISWASLDGSGGGTVNTSGATVSQPSGVALDTSDDQLYWANVGSSQISFASLSGSGGVDLPISSSDVDAPQGVAIDTATDELYWANQNNTIGYAKIDASQAGTLTTSPATMNDPSGLSLDLAANRIYWANFEGGTSGVISYASLGGSGGADLNTGSATMNNPSFPVILKSPAGTGAPEIGGGSSAGSTLTCSQGSWAPDDLGAMMYDTPESYSYSWARNGATISGATSGSYATEDGGSYTCTVTASNFAGSASQTSAPYVVATPGPPTVQITMPGPGVTFLRGSSVSPGFSCSDPNGPGIASCSDGQPIGAGKARLNTGSVGMHTFSVTAVSRDGQSATASKTYYVIAVKLLTSHATVRRGRARITVRCLGARLSQCAGTLTLTRGRRGKAKFRVAGGDSRKVTLRLRGTGSRATVTARIDGVVAAKRKLKIAG